MVTRTQLHRESRSVVADNESTQSFGILPLLLGMIPFASILSLLTSKGKYGRYRFLQPQTPAAMLVAIHYQLHTPSSLTGVAFQTCLLTDASL